MISHFQLFHGISEGDATSMLQCLNAYSKQYKKNEIIYHEGDIISCAGLLLSGEAHIEKNDRWGNQSILAAITAGELFSESYACIPDATSMVNVVAVKNSEVLFLNTKRVLQTCSNACAFHARLIQNLLTDLAQKNLQLTRKMSHTTSKSIRGRVLSYLSFQAIQHGTYQFEIPFSRQQLADYLCVDRSALSNELGKMQRDGLITFQKNRFCLKVDAAV